MPQFFNVVAGDMSIIGPRPLIPGELEEHGGRPPYNKVKPGLTGWWACNGRSDIEYDERLDLEYYYVTHCSLYLDALCVLRTVLAVFKKAGAK
ncbi:MAG: sugar transferase [Adlercreutzia sp.]